MQDLIYKIPPFVLVILVHMGYIPEKLCVLRPANTWHVQKWAEKFSLQLNKKWWTGNI